ncbi:hypothetical protein DDZ15_03450 [Rhodohalobacter mucosus]|uniref:Uncharacterized protein n=1 Tax=Rhodohalobacter mucosus TaxID=2079485 RepID=A0A316TXI4_9BACT|nr:hypothetical protein DDZ15_03450 [Rhodohalobacter mucosus]
MLFLGIASIGYYIYSVIDALDKADQSVIYWYLIFVFIGIPLVASGIYFILIGYKSSKEKNYTVIATYSLGALGVFIIFLILSGIISEWSADNTGSERSNQEELQKSPAAGMHHIEHIEINEFDQNGFSFTVHFSEGTGGSYRLEISINEGKTVFLEEAEEIELAGFKTEVTRYVSFDKLFQKCFDEFQSSNVYVCTENTGATSFFTLESQLFPIRENQQSINTMSTGSAEKTKFSLDTFTKEMEVRVNHFQLIDR